MTSCYQQRRLFMIRERITQPSSGRRITGISSQSHREIYTNDRKIEHIVPHTRASHSIHIPKSPHRRRSSFHSEINVDRSRVEQGRRTLTTGVPVTLLLHAQILYLITLYNEG
ncbi:hypothetical protein U1Q18_007860, partial [Sarracenia purpurea var. burkii]